MQVTEGTVFLSIGSKEFTNQKLNLKSSQLLRIYNSDIDENTLVY